MQLWHCIFQEARWCGVSLEDVKSSWVASLGVLMTPSSSRAILTALGSTVMTTTEFRQPTQRTSVCGMWTVKGTSIRSSQNHSVLNTLYKLVYTLRSSQRV